MTRIVIAGDANLPDDVKHGDTLKITATVFVHGARLDLIDVTAPGGPRQTLPGELIVETVAIHCVAEQAFSVGTTAGLDLSRRSEIENAIYGALRGAVEAHGPLTGDKIGYATARVFRALEVEAPSPAG